MNQQKRAAGVTFAVSEVKRATRTLPELPYAEALAATLGQGGSGVALEAYSRDTRPLVNPIPDPEMDVIHAFIYAANFAYSDHRPLVLSPDMIWLLIAQGVALHVNVNAETLRERFVSQEGKAKIEVRRDEFVRGFAGNDWEGVFAEFSEQIKEHVGERAHSLVVRRFSTTGIVECAAFEVTLMDAFQSYFDYSMLSLCGIPEITLEGTTEDWQAVRIGAADLTAYDLDWWTQHLLPLLDQFVAASQGDVDLSFWRNFYKISNQSGGPYINGHIINLFPYLVAASPSPRFLDEMARCFRDNFAFSPEQVQDKLNSLNKSYGGEPQPFRNAYLGWRESASDDRAMKGLTSGILPPALSVAPFTWKYYDKKLSMEFVAGFIGVTQDADTLALRPEIGWAVRERAGHGE